MREPLLVECFIELPEDALEGINDLPPDRQGLAHGGRRRKESPGKAKRRAVLHLFRQQVQERYNEGTLARLLCCDDSVARRAAAFALGQVGTMECNEALALVLHDADDEAAELAEESLWRVWGRGDEPAQGDGLYPLMRKECHDEALEGLDALIERHPCFAEAYHQRAVTHYRAGGYWEAARDCEAAAELNPWHFAALAGAGLCWQQLRRPDEALKAFQAALRVHPRLEGAAEAMRAIEDEGR